MASKIPLKLQIRLETKRGWEGLSDEEKTNVFVALNSALDKLGVEYGAQRRHLYGPQWEETNVSKSLTELCWEFSIPAAIV